MTETGLGFLAATGAAIGFGSADFLGGTASRRSEPVVVAAAVQLVGLGCLLAALPMVGAPAKAPALWFGSAAGLGVGLGLAALYAALSRGNMGVVTGVTGIAAAAVALVGDALLVPTTPRPVQLVGIACAFGASWAASARGVTKGGLTSVAFAVSGGAAFGVSFLLLGRAAQTSPLWGLAAARAVAVLVLVVPVWTRGRAVRLDWRIVGPAGVLDAAANALFVVALVSIPVGLATAVGAASPPLVTMVLAWWLLSERANLVGLVAVGFACSGILLIALG